VATGFVHRQCGVDAFDDLIDVEQVLWLGALFHRVTDIEVGHELVVPGAVERRKWKAPNSHPIKTPDWISERPPR
jgi:hypothetical protein